DPEKKRKNLEDCRIGSIFLLFISLRWKALRFSGDRRRSVRLSIQCSLLCPINVVLKLTSRKETLALLCLYSSGVPDAYWCPHSLTLLLVQSQIRHLSTWKDESANMLGSANRILIFDSSCICCFGFLLDLPVNVC
ncbi:uncharacterized protein LOC110034774, partial [Phalaenopsis equestris]|uniref:uncharacterized protein LOC110034774 n=1 Tax=Phalaenopsis equestris TaxID=78828 RepID=UPI0009E3DF7C